MTTQRHIIPTKPPSLTNNPRSWITQAACAGADPDLWDSDTSSPAYAVGICQGCPVRQPCYDEQIARETTHSTWGIWGGTTPAERSRTIAKRKGYRKGRT